MTSIYDNLDYFYYHLGANVIPIDSRNKLPLVNWKEWQWRAIPSDVFEMWKQKGLFEKGYGILTGKLWKYEKEDYYLICIDCDNELALKELVSTFKEFDVLKK